MNRFHRVVIFITFEMRGDLIIEKLIRTYAKTDYNLNFKVTSM